MLVLLLADDDDDDDVQVEEVEQEEDVDVVDDDETWAKVVGKELKAFVRADADGCSVYCSRAVRKGSPRSGVVSVGGDEEADVVTETVVMPIKLVVTIVSMSSGDESAVTLSNVGVLSGSIGVVDPPPVEIFLSIVLLSSAGAAPPRHGKQQRNSVGRNIVPGFHDFPSVISFWPQSPFSFLMCTMRWLIFVQKKRDGDRKCWLDVIKKMREIKLLV